MDRETFLRQSWVRYPAMPEGWKGARVTACLETVLELSDGGRIPLSGSSNLPANVLREGDVVAYDGFGSERWILLAPHLEDFSVSSTPEIQQRWSQFLTGVRQFFLAKNFAEAVTPTLVTCPGTEPFLDPFSTELKVGSRVQTAYLPTSPELHLKKMLAAGYDRVFEIKSCYRNGEITDHHQPEFFMLEWYRTYASLKEIKSDLRDLVQFVARQDGLGCLSLPQITDWREVSMAQLFHQYLGVDLTPTTEARTFRQWAAQHGVHVREDDSIDDLFYALFVEKIEPQLPRTPLIVTHYPPFQAAYARLTSEGWADRFEFYWQGLEIANAFHEVNDPMVQEQRMRADMKKRQQSGRGELPLDEEFFRALRSAMPPAGGIALGLERLFMALWNIERIQDLKVFPLR